MSWLGDLFSPRARLLAQQRQIRELERRVAELEARNESMREGMRRCLSCEYRLAFRGHDEAATEPLAHEHKVK